MINVNVCDNWMKTGKNCEEFNNAIRRNEELANILRDVLEWTRDDLENYRIVNRDVLKDIIDRADKALGK